MCKGVFPASPVVDERIHENLLLYDLLDLWFVVDEVPVVVVADDDGAGLGGQVEDVPVVVADEATAAHLAGGREREEALLLKFGQDALIWNALNC